MPFPNIPSSPPNLLSLRLNTSLSLCQLTGLPRHSSAITSSRTSLHTCGRSLLPNSMPKLSSNHQARCPSPPFTPLLPPQDLPCTHQTHLSRIPRPFISLVTLMRILPRLLMILHPTRRRRKPSTTPMLLHITRLFIPRRTKARPSTWRKPTDMTRLPILAHLEPPTNHICWLNNATQVHGSNFWESAARDDGSGHAWDGIPEEWFGAVVRGRRDCGGGDVWWDGGS